MLKPDRMIICRICQKNSLRKRFEQVSDSLTGEVFSILDCPHCVLLQTFPQPENLVRYYSDYHGERHGFTAEFRAWRQASMLGQGDGKKVLDIGCGSGTFLQAAIRRSWQAFGTELNPQTAQAKKLEVWENLAQVKANYGAEFFDAVTLWHSLEHFSNPAEILSEVSQILKKDGVLLISVPNVESFQARFFRENWWHIDVPRHLFHFSPESLTLLLEKNGFEVVKTRHQEFEYDLLGWSQSALNTINRQPNIFFKTLSGQAQEFSLPEIIFNFLLGTFFSALFLPMLPLGAWFKKGGTFIIKAVKNQRK